MSKDNYHRFPDDEKVMGVDYKFYRELLAGKYEDEVNQELTPEERRPQLFRPIRRALTKA